MMKTRRLVWVAAGLVGACLLVCAGAAAWLALGGPRPAATFTQQQAEQQALAYVQQQYNGDVTAVVAQSVTLAQVNGPLSCSTQDWVLHQLPVLTGADAYNPCDPNTLVWLVRIDGQFAFGQGYHGNRVEVLYTAAGVFIRAQGGTR